MYRSGKTLFSVMLAEAFGTRGEPASRIRAVVAPQFRARASN
jgi:hypothetical protein